MFEDSYSVINNSDEINLLDYYYNLVLIPNGISVTIDGVLVGPFDLPIIMPLTTSPYNVVPTTGYVYFIGNRNFLNNNSITGDNYIISDLSQGEEIIIGSNNDDIVWS